MAWAAKLGIWSFLALMIPLGLVSSLKADGSKRLVRREESDKLIGHQLDGASEKIEAVLGSNGMLSKKSNSEVGHMAIGFALTSTNANGVATEWQSGGKGSGGRGGKGSGEGGNLDNEFGGNSENPAHYELMLAGSYCSGSWATHRMKVESVSATQSLQGCADAVAVVDAECSDTFYYGVEGGTGYCRCVRSGKTCQVGDWQPGTVYKLTQAPTPEPTPAPDHCYDVAGNVCNGCLADDNVCHMQPESWCDTWDTHKWCGTEQVCPSNRFLLEGDEMDEGPAVASSCVPDCPPGYNDIPSESGPGQCHVCRGISNRRRSQTCHDCAPGHVSKGGSDECELWQDTCQQDQCEACSSCLVNLAPQLASCVQDSEDSEDCYNPGTMWCSKALEAIGCQSSGLGCWYKLMCKSACICPEWKDIFCGGATDNEPCLINLNKSGPPSLVTEKLESRRQEQAFLQMTIPTENESSSLLAEKLKLRRQEPDQVDVASSFDETLAGKRTCKR